MRLSAIAGCCLLLASGGQLLAENIHADLSRRIVMLAGLPPASSGDELRVWSVSAAADGNFVIVLRPGSGGVRGDVVRWWPARYAPDASWNPPGWRCAKRVVEKDLRLCRAAFERAPDFAALLRDFERDDVWSLPDGSKLPRAEAHKETIVYGADLVVEVHRSGASRAYAYRIPGFRAGPDAVKADRILTRAFNFILAIGKTDAR